MQFEVKLNMLKGRGLNGRSIMRGLRLRHVKKSGPGFKTIGRRHPAFIFGKFQDKKYI